MILQFFNDSKSYEIKPENIKRFSEKIDFFQCDIPEKTDGFMIIDDDNQVSSFIDYNIVYTKGENYISFVTNKYKKSYLYLIFNEDKFVRRYIISNKEISKYNYVLYASGIGAKYEYIDYSVLFDTEGFPNLKINIQEKEVLDENTGITKTITEKIIVDVTEEDKMILRHNNLLNEKNKVIQSLSDTCEKNILAGIVYNDKHYAYELTDQNNLYNSVQLSLATGLSVPYHATDENCEMYSQEDIIAIYAMQEHNLTHNITYYNQLKRYINTLTTIEEVRNVQYGQELTGEYLEKYNEIMAQAELITQAFLTKTVAATTEEE